MNSKPYLAFAFSLLLTSSAFAGQQEEIDKAMKMYGDEARTIMNDAEDALKKGIPEVEDYFNNPGEVKKPQESFFGFGQKRVPTFVQCRVTTEGAVKAGHDRISGNIFISDAIEKFDRFGESA